MHKQFKGILGLILLGFIALAMLSGACEESSYTVENDSVRISGRLAETKIGLISANSTLVSIYSLYPDSTGTNINTLEAKLGTDTVFTLLFFDIVNPPHSGFIDSAFLYFTGESGNIASAIFPIADSWNPDDLTWKMRPNTRTSGIAMIEISPGVFRVDITNFLRSISDFPSENYGLMIKPKLTGRAVYTGITDPLAEKRPWIKIFLK